jgi:hypothetical protein
LDPDFQSHSNENGFAIFIFYARPNGGHGSFNEKEFEEGQVGPAIAYRITQLQRRIIWAEGWERVLLFSLSSLNTLSS